VGSWLELPLDDASVDAVIGDGSLNSLGTEADRLDLMREAARVLRPGGRAAIRLFAAPELREGLEEIAADAGAGRSGSFHAFKLRLAMALAGPDPDCAVPVSDIRSAVEKLHPDREALAGTSGWKLEEIATIDSYRNSDVTYSFATAARLAGEAGKFFAEVGLAPSGSYHMADRCPVLVMRQARLHPAMS
jgi:SAM-dependent methyltransferase